MKNPLTEYGHLILINAALLNFAPMGVEFHVKVRLERTCKRLYVSFGDSGTDSSGASSSFLLGIACGDTIIHCSDGSSGTMPAKVSACLGKKEWDTCTFLFSNGSDKGGYCRYGDPAAPNEFKNYLYCSDLGQLPNP